MSRYKLLPSQEFLQAAVDYNPDTGILTWKEDRPKEHFKTKIHYSYWKSKVAGTQALTMNNSGYRVISFNDSSYVQHRVIWKLVTGNEPIAEIDHINHDRSDNRWCNLREATWYEQQHNQSIRSDNTSGIKGVNYDKLTGTWKARVQVNNTRIHVGGFLTIEEAKLAIENKRLELHGEFAYNGKG